MPVKQVSICFSLITALLIFYKASQKFICNLTFLKNTSESSVVASTARPLISGCRGRQPLRFFSEAACRELKDEIELEAKGR